MTTLLNPPHSNRGVVIEYEGNEPLTVMIDYIRVSFKTHDVDKVLEEVVHLKKDFMEHRESGFYGYIGTYVLDNIKVFYAHPTDSRGILIEMSGQGCRQFEAFLKCRGKTWYDFFGDCIDRGGKFPRLDIAIDDRKTYFDIPMLLGKIKNGEAISKFKKSDYNGSLNIEDGDVRGTTIYFGSKSSEVYLCFYQKNYEQSEKYNRPVEDYGEWNRYELRLKNDRASVAISEMLRTGNMLVIAKQIIHNYLRFVEKSDLTRETWKVSDFWADFIEDISRLKLYSMAQEEFYIKTKNWLQKSVAPTIKMVKSVDDTMGRTDLDDMVESAKLSSKQEHMMKVFMTEIKEMVC